MADYAKVFRLLDPRTLVVEEEVLPRVGPGMVRARTLCSAISPGTEVAAYQGAPPLRPMKVYPRLVGYCNVAEVVAVGEGVDDLAVGDRVYSHQSHRSEFVCDRDAVLPVPAGSDPVMMSTAYLFHLGYTALLKGGHAPGGNVAVIGLGALGLAAVAVARLAGAGVLAVSTRQEARDLASVMGAHGTVVGEPDAVRESARMIAGDVGIDLVVLTSNAWGAYRLALESVRSGGSVALLGFPGREDPLPPFNPLDSRYLFDKQLTVFACGRASRLAVSAEEVRHTWAHNMGFLMGRIHMGDIDPSPLVSRTVCWEELDALYAALADRTPGLVAAVLDWR